MKLTSEKLKQGMTVRQYIDQIKVNKEPFIKIHESVGIPGDVRAAFDSLSEPLTIAAFTADWCGDALSTTPTILRLAESIDTLSISVFNRDEELELTNSFLPENRAGTVPVFVVYDPSMNEIARFIETANELVPDIDAMDDVIARELASESPENVRRMRGGHRTAYRVERAREWGNVILKAFQRTITDGLSLPPEGRPAIGGTKWPE
jgi:thiol-disulfide isomerase/thioredoxin